MTSDKLARADSAYSLAREAGDETIVVGLDFALALVNIARAAREVESWRPQTLRGMDALHPQDRDAIYALRHALAVLDGDQ